MNVWQRLAATQPYDRISPSGGEGGVPLRRALGVAGLIGVGLGTMLGGIFTTIGSGAQAAGAGGVLASFALTGIACIFVALCYAELAAMVPIAGSAYTYAYATLGEFVAWIIGWDLILEYGISVAPTAAAWSGSVQSFLTGFQHHAAARAAGRARRVRAGRNRLRALVDRSAGDSRRARYLGAARDRDSRIDAHQHALRRHSNHRADRVRAGALRGGLAGAFHAAVSARRERDHRRRRARVLRLHRLRHGNGRIGRSARTRCATCRAP